jgi:ligand-binding sensor domain-containing protein/PAS domain-containing protein
MKYLIGLVAAIIWAVLLNGQNTHIPQNQYTFKYLTIDEGLSNNHVGSVCQDKKGFIWFATQNGADKYDGQSIINYRHNPDDSTTISGNDVKIIFSDNKGNLWVGSDKGLDLYNPEKDNFVRFYHNKMDTALGNVEDLDQDSRGNLWIAASTGLYAYNHSTREMEIFRNYPDRKKVLPDNNVFRLMADNDNKIWISVLNKGICIYDQDKKSFKCFSHDPLDSSSISGNRIERFYQDDAGNIWIGTFNNGLNMFNPAYQSFTRIMPDPENSYTGRVRAIFEDRKGNFFVGTRIGLYMKKENEFIPYANTDHNFSTLSQNSILCSYIDRTGTLWLGTFAGGVNFTNLLRKEFINYRARAHDNHFLSSPNVYSFTEDKNGNLWIGTDNGLNYLDRGNNTFTYYFNDETDPYSISYNDIKALTGDKKGNLWIGTNRGGLNYYNYETGSFLHYNHDPDDLNSLSCDKIYGLLNDRDNNLWILTNKNIDNQQSSIDIFQDGQDKFIHLQEKAYFGIIQNKEGNIYIGSIGGIWEFNYSDSIFNFIANDSLIGKVYAMLEDSYGYTWIGSDKGLTRYDNSMHTFLHFSENKGHPVNIVYGILEDNGKNLWISTNFGLVKAGNIVENPDSVVFRVYDRDDGLQSKQFNYNAFYKCNSGEMIFGGIKGFNTFYPERIEDNIIPPNIVIADLKIFNKTVIIGEEVRGRKILKKSISETERIKLGYRQNIISIEFAALHYANPKKNAFKYILEGYDKQWQYTTANFASYANLPPGKYTFKVTASNPDNIWNTNPVELKVTIRRPYWKTWWFYTILLILAIRTVYWLIRRREAQLKKDKQKLSDQLEKERKVLLEQQEQLKEQEDNIRKRDEMEKETSWHNKGLIRISEITSKSKESIEMLVRSILNEIVEYVEAQQGVLYLENDSNYKNKHLEVAATYAVDPKKLKNKKILPGEGLAGTCYKEGEILEIRELPKTYSKIQSGLGDVQPGYLVFIPIKLDEQILGILEISSFLPLESYKINYIEKASESVASVIYIVQANERARKAMDESHMQAEEIKATDEELKQNLEELTATQEELVRKNEAFKIEKAMFDTLMNFMQDRVTFKDVNSNYLRINKIKSDALKLKNPDHAIGKSDTDFFGKEHFDMARKEEMKILESGKKIPHVQEQIRYDDGTVQWYDTSRLPFKDSDGKLTGLLVISRNITEHNDLVSNLKGKNEVLMEVFGEYPLIYYRTTFKGNIVQIYGKGLNLLGLSAKKAENKDIFELFPQMKKKISIEELKDQKRIKHTIELKNKVLQAEHLVIRDKFSGGITGCIIIKEENTREKS